MPYYTFVNKKTGKTTKTLFMSISEGEEWIEAHPGWDYAPAAPVIGDPYKLSAVGHKPSSPFREKLKQIKSFYPGSNVNDF